MILLEKVSRMKLKICVVGERGVGKTSLLNRYVFNTFDDVHQTGQGTRMSLINSMQIVLEEQTVDAEVTLFDLMGDKPERDAFKDVLFWGANGFLAVADARKPESIQALQAWTRVVRSIAGDIPFHIVINKIDQAIRCRLDPEDSEWLLSTFPQVPQFLVSAKSGVGVDKAFDSLIRIAAEGALARSAVRKAVNTTSSMGEKIMSFAKRRSPIGVAKKDLLMVFRNVEHDVLLEEVENLRKLGLVTVEPTGPGSFVVKLTEKGEKELEQMTKLEQPVEKLAGS